ncbi:MAG: NUDIX domain-containing protein [Pseudomonadota bacterium]|nr:NUDIX domain-containing protein [Pseudomonadota bacterium]
MTPGVGCGAAILRDGRLLLVKRRKAPEAGCWNLPGGKVDFGEAAADATRREIAEELGVEIALTGSLGFVEMIGLDGQHWVSPIYQARISAGEPVNVEPEKHEAFVWADLDAPPAPLALAAREAIVRLRERA